MTAYSRHLIKRSCLASIIVLMGTGTSHVVVETKAAATIRFAAVADHTYRVVGRARFLLVSFSADDVGGARLMWRRDDNGESIRLLVGSEPARAPRDLNEWAYSSEEVHGDRADAFLVRSETPSRRRPAEVQRRRPAGFGRFGRDRRTVPHRLLHERRRIGSERHDDGSDPPGNHVSRARQVAGSVACAGVAGA